MPRIRNNIQEAKEDLSSYFHELAHSIKSTSIQFNGVDELINFAMLDIVTGVFHSKPSIDQERFIYNLKSILVGLERHIEQTPNKTRK